MSSASPNNSSGDHGSPGPQDRRPVVVVAHDDPGGHLATASWRWYEADFPEIRWIFVSSAPANALEKRLRRAIVLRTRCAWQAVRVASKEDAKLLITNEPELTFRCALMSRRGRARIPHLAWAFNFAGLPRGRIRPGLMRAGFPRVDRFVVSSSMERHLYAATFGIPPEKIDLLLWAVDEPVVAHPETPEVPGDYICAAGSNARDYRTLLAAMAKLPSIPLVIVARPDALEGLEIPKNVTVRSSVSMGVANNIIAHSRFAVLPLADGQTPNGHVTLVNSMKLARATVITDSEGITDYAHPEDAVLCRPNSSESMAEAIGSLWEDRGRSEALGAAARRFAREHCEEASSKNQLRRYFIEYGLIGPEKPEFSRSAE